ncbi:PH and SEC7 domain-containing protein isoform X4 [Anabrus simplex]|uniref:PH and SEC7 domain-containing protein isoform X4 n=1 Tax=Anabrus simplex TaxID=316456 RepID=UPI0035A3C62B
MAEERLVVLRRSDSCGLGFSILGTTGLPPIIYDIVENSPAAESGEVEAGDVILKVNETDVNRFTTKEVLKCLRLSTDPVTLKLKRDPVIKARVRHHLTSQNADEDANEEVSSKQDKSKNNGRAESNGTCSSELEALLPASTSVQDSFEEGERLQWEPLSSAASDKFSRPRPPRFEAFMMTGELILNLSRTQQSSGLLPKHQKKVDSLRYHHHYHHHHHNSVPTSPNEMEMGHRNHHHHHFKSASAPPAETTSAGTSPVGLSKRDNGICTQPSCAVATSSSVDSKGAASFPYHVGGGFVRTSRSEDHLQFQKDSSMSAVDIDIDEDVTSSLNTLLDTRQDSGGSSNNVGHEETPGTGTHERIVWTYNAPVASSPSNSGSDNSCCILSSAASRSASSGTSSEGVSPQRSLSPASPTSVSSSVMSSNSSSRKLPIVALSGPAGDTPYCQQQQQQQPNGDLSQSEAVSNISSPDFQEEETLDILSSRDLMEELRESEDELTTLGEDPATLAAVANKTVSPPLSSEDESDVESLHSFHYSPKAVDIPSAIRLAKRLYMLDGFKKSDVSRHLSKNNDFSRVVAEEYLKYFSFEGDTLDIALRKFLKQFSLTGETQERERVLVHFSKRYLDCNPGTFNSQDAVHTLTCAIMLLNTDLHGQNIGRKMTCTEFIENLSELNDGDNFPREVLKLLYHAIKSYPLEWALDEEGDECSAQLQAKQQAENQQSLSGSNPFLDVPNAATAIEYKKGYVMRKSCIDPNGKKTPFGKRGWKMFYCTLRDMVLYLHKDEHGFRKSALSDNLHNAIRIHHALATKASDYTKKQHVFRLQTADQAEYLFQTSDSKELQSWIDTINFVCASFSAQPLAGAVGSQRKFQRPLLPCSHTKLNLREQLRDHEERVQRLETELEEHRKHPPERSAKSLNIQNYKEKDAYLHYELKRYKTYAYLLRSRMSQYPELEPSLVETCIGEVDEGAGAVALMEPTSGEGGGIVPPPVPDRRTSPTTNRKSPSEPVPEMTSCQPQDKGV